MKLKFDISIDTSDRTLLETILQCSRTQLPDNLNKIARSAFEEYLKMILGQKVFTRGKDIQEFRLFIFIKYFFDGKIPDEQKICGLFQTTAAESRALIRSIMSKYQYELRDTIHDSLREQVVKVKKDINGDDYKLSIQNQFFKDELNRILGAIDTSLPIIEKDKGTISTYVIKASSYQKLCELYSIEATIEQ